MATDSMAGPQGSDSLDEWASEACTDADLDDHSAGESGRAATLASLSEGETTQRDSNCEAPADDHTKTVEGSGRTENDRAVVPPSGSHSAAPSEEHTEAGSKDVCVKPVSAEEDKVPSEECSSPSAPQLGGGEPSDEAEVKTETQIQAELPVVQAEKTSEQISTSSEPVVQGESPAYEKGADSANGGHTHVSGPSPQQVSGIILQEPSVETGSDPPDAPDSPVFLSAAAGEDTQEELSVDCKPLDFSSAREQWVRRDSSSSKPPTPAGSRSSSVCYPSDQIPGLANILPLAEEAPNDPGLAMATGVQQGEEMPHSPAVLLNENQEGQQVCKETPPMDTVAGQLANPAADSPGAGPIVVKEPLTEAGKEREGVEAERESGQTSKESEQAAASVPTPQTQEEDGQPEGEAGQSTTHTEQSTPAANAATAKMKGFRMEDPYDDNQSDSGVSADFSAEVSTRTPLSDSPEPGKPPPNETPIEREIRLAAEREQSLRQARGLTSTDKAQEFVEIPLLRPILSQNLPSVKATKDKGKERQFAGKKMQREISQETQREQDLVQLGRVAGFYEKGTVRQLRERKQLFEAFQQPKEVPTTPTATNSASQSKRTTTSVSASDLSNLDAPGDGFSASSTYGGSTERRYSLEQLANPQSPAPSAFGPGLSEGSDSQVVIVEGHYRSHRLPLDHTQPPQPSLSPGFLTEVQSLTVVDSGTSLVSSSAPEQPEEEEEEEVNSAMVRENPFFKLRPSMGQRPAVERDIRQAQQRERELRKQRTSLYQWAEGGTANREAPDKNGLLVSQQQTQNCSTTSAQHFLGKSDAALREPTEALKSPPGAAWTPRQKTPLVQRWETGMVNGRGEEED